MRNMLNNKSHLSPGFVILFITISFGIFFMQWATNPLSHEKAQLEEKKGHQFAKEGKIQESIEHFLKAAEIGSNDLNTSRRYRLAGTASSDIYKKINFYQLALKYNSNNKNALRGLESLGKAHRYNEGWYINRFEDGYSQGKSGKSIINTANNNQKYILSFFTNNTKNSHYKVKIFIDGEWYSSHRVIKNKTHSIEAELSTGLHIIKFEINGTFSPKELGWNQDDRDLGVNFKVIKQDDCKQ